MELKIGYSPSILQIQITGWAVGDHGTILKTSNGGNKWISQNSGTKNQLNSVCFTDSNTGWVVSDSGTILKTTDGGDNWISQNCSTGEWLQSVYFRDSNTGWVVGDNTILKTTDSGNNWKNQNSGMDYWGWGLESVYFTQS